MTISAIPIIRNGLETRLKTEAKNANSPRSAANVPAFRAIFEVPFDRAM